MRLKGKTAIVTGGGRGIGKEIAIRFAEEGADVVVADIDTIGAKETASEIEKKGVRIIPLEIDISQSDQVNRMIETTVKEFGKVDILVNNAVYIKKMPFLEFSEDEWNRIMNVCLNGYFLCSQMAAREMIKQGRGRIINIATLAAAIAHAGLSAYAVAKAGVIAMTKLIGIELHKYNINVNAIAPGPIETPLMKKVMERFSGEKKMPGMGVIGKPQDVAHVALFLASDDSAYIYGNVLSVGGGFIGEGIMPEK
ncbi:MAG: SDR family oxidoreductase [Nitrospirae bacterium]|nr:SDR family oxidoreductase [Nitrospirota bacterium]